MSQTDTTTIIYTDGACLDNPGPGGYAALIIRDGKEQIIVGRDFETTNNQMELTAAIVVLEALPAGSTAVLHSDSQYVVKGVTEWLSGWKRRGWKNGQKKPVLNRSLWERLDTLNAERNIRWQWVRGHVGQPENERVDSLANAEAERAHREAIISW